jgi:hypothetical protein
MKTLTDYINRPILWKTEYTDGTKVNDLFVGVKVEDDVLYDSENDRWVDLEYAENNCIDDNYIFSEEDRDRIEFDHYGRPYIQHGMGRLMLSRKTKYNYTIKN